MATCPNKTLQSWKDLVSRKGEDLAYYLWDKYSGEIPESEYQTIGVKPGVSELFESNPELSSIGTVEQYSQYLDTIFPDSKVKDIVYHGAKNKESILEEGFKKNRRTFRKEGTERKGHWFFKTKINAQMYQMDETGYVSENSGVIFTLLNITNPKIKDYSFSNNFIAITNDVNDLDTTKFDSVIGYNVNEDVGLDDEYVVFEPKQIHILGSKQDVEGFKSFMKFGSTRPGESATDQELSLYLSNKMNQNFNISNPGFSSGLSIDDIVTRHVPATQQDIDNKKEEC